MATRLEFPTLILLIAVSSFSPFTMTLCAPALPAIGTAFGASIEQTQLLISVYLLGLAVMQPVHGMLADRFGRRPILLWAFALFTLSSLLCTVVWDLSVLAALRCLQAVGIAASTVVARAVIRDSSDPEDSARHVAYLSAGMGVAPIAAPVLAGVLIGAAGWRSIFGFTGALAVPALVWLWRALPETLTPVACDEHPLRTMRQNLSLVTRSWAFWGFTITFAFINAAFLTFLTNAPGFFVSELEIGPAGFGLFMSVMSLAYVAGAVAGGRVLRAAGMLRTLLWGLVGALLLAFALLLLARYAGSPVALIFVLLACLLAFSGIVNPLAMAGVALVEPRVAGTAAGVSGSISMCLCGLAVVLVAFFYDATMLSLIWPITAGVVLSACGYLLVIGDGGKTARYLAASRSRAIED